MNFTPKQLEIIRKLVEYGAESLMEDMHESEYPFSCYDIQDLSYKLDVDWGDYEPDWDEYEEERLTEEEE